MGEPVERPAVLRDSGNRYVFFLDNLECDAHALTRFDSESAHLGENLFSRNIIEYLFHTFSLTHVLIEYTDLDRSP